LSYTAAHHNTNEKEHTDGKFKIYIEKKTPSTQKTPTKPGIVPTISQTTQTGEFTAQLLCDQLLDRVDKYFLCFPLLQSWHCSSAFWKNWSFCQTAWHCSN